MWSETDNKLYKSITFKDFSSAFAFITRVALIAETHNHHPKWTNEYNKVEIWLFTHEENKITEKDWNLAAKIDELL